MKIVIASDHGGFELKSQIVLYLKKQGHDADDMGCFDGASVDYPDLALKAASEVSQGRADRAILFCGTGIGMAITANKLSGIRAASIVDLYSARLAREHNDLNVLCLGGRVLGLAVAQEIVDLFILTPFAAGRHEARVKKIINIENN